MKKVIILLLTLILLVSLIGCQKAGNETEPETTAPTETEFSMPEQSYIGVWQMDTEIVPANSIYIYEITADTVKFGTGVRDWHFGFEGTAVVRDGALMFGDGISPDYMGPSKVKGRLEFSDNHITVIYDSFGDIEANQQEPNNYQFTVKHEESADILERMKNESNETVPQLTYPAHAEPALESAIQTVIDKAQSKDWKEIEVIEGEPDARRRWGIVLEPCALQDGETVYTVIGRSDNVLSQNPFYVVVKIAYHYGSKEWRIAEMSYMSLSGRPLADADVKNQFPSEYEAGEIVSANHPALFDYMYGY